MIVLRLADFQVAALHTFAVMERRQSSRPQHILIADDNDDVRELWKLCLTSWGFTVEEARDGAEAVRKARARKPDLVLMDLWMPGVDGVEATRQLRNDPAMADVPVLAITATTNPPARAAAQKAGCDEFLAKPLLPDELLMQVRAAFAQGRRHSTPK